MQRAVYLKQLLTFYLLACLISWTIWLPLYGPALGIKGLPVLPYHHALGGLGPLAAAFLTHALLGQKNANRQLLRNCFKGTPVVYLLIALFNPFLLALAAAGLSSWIFGENLRLSGLLQSQEFPDFNILVFFLYNLVFFGFGEEVGWRGFMLPRMQARHTAFVAAVLLTVFWALWHWPLFLYRPGYNQMNAAGISGWVVSLLTGSILLSWLYNSSKGSVLICAVFHATIDIPFTSGITDARYMGLLGFLITLWGIAILVWMKPRNLAKTERQQLSGLGTPAQANPAAHSATPSR